MDSVSGQHTFHDDSLHFNPGRPPDSIDWGPWRQVNQKGEERLGRGAPGDYTMWRRKVTYTWEVVGEPRAYRGRWHWEFTPQPEPGQVVSAGEGTWRRSR